MAYNCSICKREFDFLLPHLVNIRGRKKPHGIYCSLECAHKDERPKHKFNATRCESDDIKFGSKRERGYYHKLQYMQKLGEVIFFLRQVPFDLPGGTKYFADFQVFYADGTVSFVDVKGVSTQMFIMKKKQVESLYPITIEVVK